MEIRFNFIKEDFENSDYSNQKDCAITRALKRMGLPWLYDTGTAIATRIQSYKALGGAIYHIVELGRSEDYYKVVLWVQRTYIKGFSNDQSFTLTLSPEEERRFYEHYPNRETIKKHWPELL